MASVQSLGLCEPSALSYLVAESILPPDPPASSYDWQRFCSYGTSGQPLFEDELLITPKCVVWSRSEAIKRVYNLDIEGDTIVQALVTQFALEQVTAGKSNNPSKTQHKKPIFEQALVILLKTQVHILLGAGDRHILPLSFDVEKAFPTAYGFLLQRKLTKDDVGCTDKRDATNRVSGPSAEPRNIEERVGSRRTSSPALQDLIERHGNQFLNRTRKLPRTFSFSEIQSELGIVVSVPATSKLNETTVDEQSQILSVDEELIYISPYSESQQSQIPATERPVYCAVTLNRRASTTTVWQVRHREHDFVERTPKLRKRDVDRVPRRKSSNVFGRATGSATPVNQRSETLRESLASLNWSQVERSSSGNDQHTSEEDFATQIGHDLGEVGPQTRAARRVSSMLARTDLAAGPDRSNFKDLVSTKGSRKSTTRSVRLGGSIGSFSERQSFGRRRSSFQHPESALSTGTSYVDIPADQLLGDLDGFADPLGMDNVDLADSLSDLKRDIVFSKVKTFHNITSQSSMLGSATLPRVFTLFNPRRPNSDEQDQLCVSIMDRPLQALVIVVLTLQDSSSTATKSSKNRAPPRLIEADLRRLSNIVDACKVQDGSVNRFLILTRSRDGVSSLHLEAPWCFPFRIDLPFQFLMNNPYFTSWTTRTPERRRDIGLNRIIRHSEVDIDGLETLSQYGAIVLVDRQEKKHSLQIRLEPQNLVVREILSLCNFVLPASKQDGVLVAWWEVSRWIRTRDHHPTCDWTAFVVALFAMAIPFISDNPSQKQLSHRRTKSSLLRSSSGPLSDLTHLASMFSQESLETSLPWRDNSSWSWLTPSSIAALPSKTAPLPRWRTAASHSTPLVGAHVDFIARCVVLSREFLQTPAGEAAIGPEGYLPTAMNKDRDLRRTSLAAVLIALHLYREEQKLHTHSSLVSQALCDLAPVIAQLGRWLGWQSWSWKEGTYYSTEIEKTRQVLFEDTTITDLDLPLQPFQPPSILKYLEGWVAGFDTGAFPTLLDIVGKSSRLSIDACWQGAAKFTPRTFALMAFARQKGYTYTSSMVLDTMAKCGIDIKMLQTMPDGIGAVFNQAIATCRSSLLSSSHGGLLDLLDSNDMIRDITTRMSVPTVSRSHAYPNHEAVRDYHTAGNLALETDAHHFWDPSSEADRQAITRLIFHEDRRFHEASKLVNQIRPPLVECYAEPEWNEAELLEAQKELVQFVTRRTLSVASGRGMIHYSARIPLLTERVPIPAFSLQCVMKPPRNGADDSAVGITFSADRAAFTEDKVCWAFFHNGASAGLMISKEAKGIDTSWILYNKPPELTNRHAGFLMALGLNGHLKNLAKWVAFKYLTPKHTMTSIGLLLGLSASYLGTMDTLITRLLSVHVTRLLPVGAAELNLSPLTQTAGVMGIGLLYCGSQHRRMSEVMLSEIENNDPEEGVSEEAILRDEGYRLAAGFALGLINVGNGRQLHSLHDMGVMERLLTVAIGTKNVNLVHVLDRATAGAVIAVALIWLKTNDEALAKKIDIPDTVHQFDYVRPDIFLLRTVARHLVMWDSIQPTVTFMEKSLPRAYRHRATLRATRYLSTEDMPFFNILAGLCLAVGLRFAGSASTQARDLLVGYLDQFIRLTRLPALSYDSKLARNSVRDCQDVVGLATASVMAGTGDLVVFRRLRSLHGRTDAETPYGSHLAAHMAIGALFLGGGTHTFGTSSMATAALLCAFYPSWPKEVLDSKGHLQALRHLWVLAAEPRCLVPRNAETNRPLGVAISITDKHGVARTVTAPCLLPELADIGSLRTDAKEYWEVKLDFAENYTLSRIKESQSIYLRRRAAYDAPASDVFVSELQALADSGPAPSVNVSTAFSNNQPSVNPLDWLFQLRSFDNYDGSEKALVLPPYGVNEGLSDGRGKWLWGTIVDTRLELENGILRAATPTTASKNLGPVSVDGLWQLRLLFAWVDKLNNDDDVERKPYGDGMEVEVDGSEMESGTWLRREVIDRLKWRVWAIANGNAKT